MLRPKFRTQEFADAGMTTFEKHINGLISRIPRDGSEVDLQPLFFWYTLNAALEFLVGQDVTSSAGDDITKIFNDAEKHVGEHLLLPSFLLGRARRKAKQRKQDSEAQAGLKKDDPTEDKYTFLQELIKETDDVEKIRSELISILLAGRETTASALSSLWFVLAKRPDIVEKLQAEVQSLGGQKPNFTQLKSMPYLQNTIKEVLRLYPPLPGNLRAATEDTVLPKGGGPEGKAPIFVPKGQIILYNVYSLHRRQDIFGPDADIFRPERWEDNALRPG
ncbi:hypothetical protein N0V83_000042 [Neocucurbitaria cava]|uniref:Cytochrome P450 n=1 Tax=Neocucurbitaria cava TaxID=798079 RepID=A0A9W8YFY0_9PLEO|nr:hypothetical protein N0V83_000042 [Neocucurbitaria cava]